MQTSRCSILTGISIYHGKQCCHKVSMDSNRNFGWNSTLKIPAAYIFVQCWENKQNAIINAIFGKSPKSDSLYDHDTLYKAWMNGMKIGQSRFVKIVKLEILQSAPNDPKPNSWNRASKVPSICALLPRVPNFLQFRSTISRFAELDIKTPCICAL